MSFFKENHSKKKKVKQIINKVFSTSLNFNMVQPGNSVLVAVSGGPDSIALLHILIALAPKFSCKLGVAHLNHCLRGQDSFNDEKFVSLVAKKFNLPYYTKQIDVNKYKVKHRLSLEEAARYVRYAFLGDVAKQNRYDIIATAHHCDDNAELVLMNLIRGSGLVGISGIPPTRNIAGKHIKIVRPLIKLTKSEILCFLSLNDLDYILDKSNSDQKYLRNKIRHYLIPEVKKRYNPNIVETLNRIAAISNAEDKFIGNQVDSVFEQIVLSRDKDLIAFPAAKIESLHLALKRRVIRKAIKLIKGNLRRITYKHIDAVIELLEKKADQKSLDLPDRIKIRLSDNVLQFLREKYAMRNSMEIQNNKKFVYKYFVSKPCKKNESLFLEEINAIISFSEVDLDNFSDFDCNKQQTAYLDMDRLSFPLKIRNYQTGDFFIPIGMKGTVTIKKFFINNKISKKTRKNCPILFSNGKIAWIVGHRISELFKIETFTRKILKVELFLA